MRSPPSFSLREARLDDPAVRGVTAAVLRATLAGVPDASAGPLVAMQLRSKLGGIAAEHPSAEVTVVEVGGEPVGLLIADRSGARTRIVDLAVLPDRQGEGIGSAILEQACRAADDGATELELSVWADNPAVRLYERFGFERINPTPGSPIGGYVELRRMPRPRPTR